MSARRRAHRRVTHRGRNVSVGFALVALVAGGAFGVVTLTGDDRQAAPSRRTVGQRSPVPAARAERNSVPDACTILSATVVDDLAPGAERTDMGEERRSTRHSECVWSRYAARSRQLTIELRALSAEGGTPAIRQAVATFSSERAADRNGDNLAPSARVQGRDDVEGVGAAAYTVYSVDHHGDLGTAIANVRLGNVLVTVRYSGGDHRDAGGGGTPISERTATRGALAVARDVVAELGGDRR